MPLSDFDFDKWVDSLTVPAEQKEKFKELGKDETAKKALAEHVMLRSDYSRHLNDLQTQEKAVADKQAALADLETQYREGSTRTAAENQQLKTEMAAMRKQLFDAQEKLRTDWNSNGNVDEMLKDVGLDKVAEAAKAATATDKQQPPAFDTSKFVSVETFDNVRNAALLWPAMLAKLQMDHAALFNRKDDPAFDPVAFTLKANAEGKDPQVVYDEMFNAPARRKEIEVAAITAQVRQQLEAEYQAKIDAQANAPAPYQSLDGQPDVFGEALNSLKPKGDTAAPLTPAPYDPQSAIAELRQVRKEAIASQPG
jgi:hypothetical protein